MYGIRTKTALELIEKRHVHITMKDFKIIKVPKEQMGDSSGMVVPGYMVRLPHKAAIIVSDCLKGDRLHEIMAHEMVHVEQVVRGDLERYGNDTIWKGVTYTSETVAERYPFLPWEIEAYERAWVECGKKGIEPKYTSLDDVREKYLSLKSAN